MIRQRLLQPRSSRTSSVMCLRSACSARSPTLAAGVSRMSSSAPWIARTPQSGAIWASSIEPETELWSVRASATCPRSAAARERVGRVAVQLHIGRRGRHLRSLKKPAAAAKVVEDDEVAPALADELPVTAAQGLSGPPAVLHQPGLAQRVDRFAVNLHRMTGAGWLQSHAGWTGRVKGTGAHGELPRG